MKGKRLARRTDKFADRKNDLKECKNFFSSNESVLCISAEKSSGLSFFLLKLYEDEIFKDKKLREMDIYLSDLSDKKDLSSLLIEDILKQRQGLNFTLAQKNIFLYIIKNLVTLGLPFLYLISSESNIGFSVADSVATLINSEIPSTELIHSKIIKYFYKKKKASVVLIDSAESLTNYDLDLIRELINLDVKFIFAFKTTDDRVNKEKFFKLFPNKQVVIHTHTFRYPDEIMLKELCVQYGRDYSLLKESLLSASNDIIKVMSIIINNNIDISTEEMEVLSFVYYSDGTINKEILRICFNSNFKNLIYKSSFDDIFEQLKMKKLIIDNLGSLTTDYVFEKSFKDGIFYRLNISNIYFDNLLARNLTQIQFIISYEQQVYKKIKAILLFAKIRFKSGQNISSEMAFKLNNSLEQVENIADKKEVETVLSIYYIKEFDYLSALNILEKSNKESRLLKKLYAYVLDRSHNLKTSEKNLIELINSCTDKDELAVLVSILTIDLLHQNRVNEAIDIYYNRSQICNYKQFSNSNKKVYFLRNIAYYLDEKDAIICYETIKEVSKSRNNSLFIFTMENNKLARDLVDGTKIDQSHIDSIVTISKKVPYYEQRLLFNNLGIYYLEKNKNLAFEYFEKAIYLAKSNSELPFIFSKINYALALAYHGDNVRALNIFDEIEVHVKSSKLLRIKGSYYAAKLLLNYMMGEDVALSAQQLSLYPLRKGLKFTQDYIEQIKALVESNIKYTKKMFNSLYLKNVTFYWYIDPLDLLSSDEILSF